MRRILVHFIAFAATLAATADAQIFPWNTLSPSTSPTARERVGSATDGSVIYLYGGQVGTSTIPYDNLLAFDGTTWTELTASGTGAGPRSSPITAWDAARGKLVVFGGKGDAASWNNRLQDTWEWDSLNGWVQQFPVTIPDKRWLTNGVYAPGFGLIFHGGNAETAGGSTYTDNQTWAYDGLGWTLVASGPTVQNGTLVYRPTDNDLIYFGGTNGSGNLSDTWSFDLVSLTWTQIPTTTLPTSDGATGGPGLVGATGYFNEGSGKVVIHGGQGNGGPPSSLTWEFDGTDWTEVSWAGTPIIRNAPGQWLAATQKGYALCGNSSGSARNWTQEHGPVAYGSFIAQGTDCPTSAGLTSEISSPSMPSIGENFVVEFSNQTPGTVNYIVIGTAALPVPVPMASLLPGSGATCSLQVSTDVALAVLPADATGTKVTLSVPVPNNPAVVGLTVYIQGIQVENGPPVAAANSQFASVVFGQLQ